MAHKQSLCFIFDTSNNAIRMAFITLVLISGVWRSRVFLFFRKLRSTNCLKSKHLFRADGIEFFSRFGECVGGGGLGLIDGKWKCFSSGALDGRIRVEGRSRYFSSHLINSRRTSRDWNLFECACRFWALIKSASIIAKWIESETSQKKT